MPTELPPWEPTAGWGANTAAIEAIFETLTKRHGAETAKGLAAVVRQGAELFGPALREAPPTAASIKAAKRNRENEARRLRKLGQESNDENDRQRLDEQIKGLRKGPGRSVTEGERKASRWVADRVRKLSLKAVDSPESTVALVFDALRLKATLDPPSKDVRGLMRPAVKHNRRLRGWQTLLARPVKRLPSPRR